jgi:hypothetical protein
VCQPTYNTHESTGCARSSLFSPASDILRKKSNEQLTGMISAAPNSARPSSERVLHVARVTEFRDDHDGCSDMKEHWSNDNTELTGSSPTMWLPAIAKVHDYTKVDLQSLPILNIQRHLAEEESYTFPIQQYACFEPGDNIVEDATQFPSWEQLPVEFQDPASSADFYDTSPI